MVLANANMYTLKAQLKDDKALLFGLLFLVYLDSVGGHISLLFAFFMFVCMQMLMP